MAVKVATNGSLVRKDDGGAIALQATSGFSYKLALQVNKTWRVWYFPLTANLDLSTLAQGVAPVSLTAAPMPVTDHHERPVVCAHRRRAHPGVDGAPKDTD